MKKFFVIGNPIDHSLSPKLHTYWIEKGNIKAMYEKKKLSDNELKSGVINLFKQYFDANNWQFGETFYFTELSSFIHRNLGNAIGSIVILPKNTAGNFGDLFQVKAEPNELFISTATVNDIEIVEKITSQTLRTDR